MKHRSFSALVAALALSLSANASAASVDSNVNVAAEVSPSCSINSMSDVSFGNLDILKFYDKPFVFRTENQPPVDIRILCTAGTSYVVSLVGTPPYPEPEIYFAFDMIGKNRGGRLSYHVAFDPTIEAIPEADFYVDSDTFTSVQALSKSSVSAARLPIYRILFAGPPNKTRDIFVDEYSDTLNINVTF